MVNNQITLNIFVTTSETEKIKEFLLKGFSPRDLSDERVFPQPFKTNDIFRAILELNSVGVSQ